MKISGRDQPTYSSEELLARNQATRRNSRATLDPHGIYGTRTAYRVRTAQKRRQFQALIAALAVVLAGAGYMAWNSGNHVPSLRELGETSLDARPAAFPAWGANGNAVWLVVPTESGSLLPVNVATGALGTPFHEAFVIRTQPCLVGSTAYFAGEDGTAYAVDWQSGTKLWSFNREATISTRPAYLRSTGGSRVFIADDIGNLNALDAGTGKSLWHVALQAPAGDGLTVAENKAGPAVLVPLLSGLGTEGGIACVSATTGVVEWRDELNSVFLPAPAVTGGATGRAFAVGDNGSVVCLDLNDGKRVWKSFAEPLSQGTGKAVILRGEPLVAGYSWGNVLVCGGSDGGVRCFDADNGQLKWTFDAGASVRSRPRALSLKGADGATRDVVLFGSDSSLAYCLDARTGAPLWKCRTSGTAFATPGVAAGTVSCLTHEGDLVTFRVPST